MISLYLETPNAAWTESTPTDSRENEFQQYTHLGSGHAHLIFATFFFLNLCKESPKTGLCVASQPCVLSPRL